MFDRSVSETIAALRRPHLARRVFARLMRVSDHAALPSSMTLDITHSCNLRCIMCSQQFLKDLKPRLSTGQFEHILDEIPSLRRISILPQGEPFLNPDLGKMLRIGRQRNIAFSITTNGTLLSDENINNLTDVQDVLVSIDHPHPHGYKQIRGLDLEKVLENIGRLKQRRPEVELTISAVIMEENVKVLPDFVKLAKQVGAGSISLIHLLACWEGAWQKHGLNFVDLAESLQKTEEEAKEMGVKLSATPLLKRPRLCSEPWQAPYINVFGDVYPCCFIHSSGEERIRREFLYGRPIEVDLSQYRMGNIFREPFTQIWNAPGSKRLRKTVRDSTSTSFLARDRLMDLRTRLDPNDPNAYCKACLFRQGLAC